MQLELALPRRALLAERIAPQWRAPLLKLALAWATLFALFARDWAAMASQWWDSSTYNHVLVVPAILAWLVWQRAPQLARLTPQAWWPGVGLTAGALFVWLLGDISGTATLNQLGVVAAMQASTIAILGPRVGWALLFPLAYALFLVPIGDELVPVLQMVTAEITIWLTHLSGVPAEIEGVFIDTPVGLFEVAEACSGVKFLVAMVALGALVAHVCFRSWTRRALFMVVAVVLPILANGVRAWGTIYIAQSRGVQFAAGFDHVLYGWFFFALVMAALLAISWRFFDRSFDDAFIDGKALALASWPCGLERWNGKGRVVLAALAATMLAMLAWSHGARGVEAPMPPVIDLPEVPGWQRTAIDHGYPWEPRMGGADHRLIASYADGQGHRVDVAFALYGAQEEGREAGGFGEGALPSDSDWRWLSPAPAPLGGEGDRLQALGIHQRVAWTWYRHGDWTGSSRARLKLANVADSLTFTARPTMTLILSAEDTDQQQAEAVLAAFVQSVAPLPEWMDGIAMPR